MMGNSKMEKNERDYVKDKVVIVREVSIDTERNSPNTIRRISFKVDEGNITFKPKIQKQIKRSGIPINQTMQCTIEEIPQKVVDIFEKVRENGSQEVKVCYSVWNTQNAEGDDATYRYIQYESELAAWEIVEDAE